jgi:metal-responsive CopG/Arc/MetJ family transcriptional regulator
MSVLNKSFVVVLDVSQVDVIDTTFYKFWFKSRSALIRKAIQEYLEKHQ